MAAVRCNDAPETDGTHMDTRPNSDEARDIRVNLHPYTNARKHQQTGPLILERGEGVHVWDNHGQRYIEAMAGLWSVGVGFSEPRLVEAARRQLEKLPYYHSFSHKSHGPLIDLAEHLVEIAPVPMSKVFFTNSGSEANDTAMKLIWYRANAMGEPQRKKIIARKRGYHGVTIASASLTGLPYNHASFDLPLPGVLHTGCPHYFKEAHPGESEDAFTTRLATELEEMILAEGPETIAAFFGEPVMGAGGVVVPPDGYWAKIQAVLRRYDILLVADEVICGLGRTGRLWGSQTYEIEPDMLVSSKQLSSSYQPIAALMMNERVFEPIADETNRLGTLGHGYTAGGHPVAAAVSLENLRIIAERGLVENAAETGAYMQRRLREFSGHDGVAEVRGVGLIAAMELAPPEGAAPGATGAAMNAALLEQGVISRNMVDAVAFCPPMIITAAQIDEIVGAVGRALDATATR